MNKKVELSMGEVELRPLTAREVTEQKICASAMVSDIEAKYGRQVTSKLYMLKAKAITDVYFQTLALSVVSHPFGNGLTVEQHLENVSSDDILRLENAHNTMNTLSKDEVVDLGKPSRKGRTPRTKKTKPS